MIKQKRQLRLQAGVLACVTIASMGVVFADYWTTENSKGKAVIIVPVADSTTKPLVSVASQETSVSFLYDNGC